MTGGEDDLPAFHAGVERVAGAKSEFSPDRTGEDNLPLAGNTGLHGKNILPHKSFWATRPHGEAFTELGLVCFRRVPRRDYVPRPDRKGGRSSPVRNIGSRASNPAPSRSRLRTGSAPLFSAKLKNVSRNRACGNFGRRSVHVPFQVMLGAANPLPIARGSDRGAVAFHASHRSAEDRQWIQWRRLSVPCRNVAPAQRGALSSSRRGVDFTGLIPPEPLCPHPRNLGRLSVLIRRNTAAAK